MLKASYNFVSATILEIRRFTFKLLDQEFPKYQWVCKSAKRQLICQCKYRSMLVVWVVLVIKSEAPHRTSCDVTGYYPKSSAGSASVSKLLEPSTINRWKMDLELLSMQRRTN